MAEFANQAMITFAATVMAISVVGWYFGDLTGTAGGLLGLGRVGLSYPSLLQIFIFALLVAGIKVLVFSELLFKRMMVLWRTAIMLLLSYGSAIICAVWFRWFPVERRGSWLSFILSVTVCFVLTILLLLAKTKVEDARYAGQLSKYKESKEQINREQR